MKILRLALMSLVMLAAQLAVAHTQLAETMPADGAALSAAPENVQLRFSEPVRLTALSVQKDGGEKTSLGPLPSEATDAFTLVLPALEDGRYVVAWRALSADTHVMTGEFMFTLGPAGNSAGHAQTH